MRFVLAAAAGIAAMVTAASPAAAIINAPVPKNAYVTVGGLDWAWASPCSPGPGSTCGAIDLTYQGTQGWRIATTADFISSGMNYTKFQFAGANVPAGGGDPNSGATFFGGNNVDTACATPWFSNSYNHCDFFDSTNGYVWNQPNNQPQENACCHETWVVRNATGGAVPEPASWAMLIAGFGLVGGVARRRRLLAA